MSNAKVKTAMIAISMIASVAAAQAQATRTWVSGVGDDANPCSRTAPCKTFAGAISKTAAKGEINVLDPGGFGAVTITKSIQISSEGFEAGVLASGTNGIVINAASNDAVVLRGLDINGAGTGLNGIRILSAAQVLVENTQIRGFTQNGIDVQTTTNSLVNVLNTVISNNPGGINVLAGGAGVDFVVVNDSQLVGNSSFDVKADGANSRIILNKSMLNGGPSDVVAVNGGVIQSYGNNVIRTGNPTATIPLK
jgi:hypothetical protein